MLFAAARKQSRRRALFLPVMICLGVLTAAYIWFRQEILIASSFPTAESRLVFEQPDRLYLYSIDPGRPEAKEEKPTGEMFHGYRILGRTEAATEEQKKRVQSAFYDSLNELADAAACFEPRHALRAEKDDRVVDIVICFACRQFVTYNGDKEKSGSLMSTTAPKALDAILKENNVPLAKDLGK